MRDPTASGSVGEERRTSTAHGEGQTVLVVDDYEAGLYTKCRALTQAGFHVVEARSGQEALDKVATHHPELVVLDVRLPDIDGIAVCRSIKSDPATTTIMVLQVSAYRTSVEDQVEGIDSGADWYMPGDVSPSVLVAAVRSLLRIRRAEQALRERDQHLIWMQASEESREQLRALAARLLTAQEDERRRIARELHDDVSQRIASLALDLHKLRSSTCDVGFDAIEAQLMSLSTDLRDLSHTLHPSMIEDLGLEASLRSLCDEFERIHDLPIRCTCDLDRPVPLPVATVLYRIAQEALRNVTKHAGDARVMLTIAGNEEGLRLTIADDGCGFDPTLERHRAALGLVSMRERAALIGGRIEVQSAPMEGTTVEVFAPWPAGA